MIPQPRSLLRDRGRPTPPERRETPEHETSEGEARAIRCAVCRAEVGDEAAIFGVGGADPIQVFINPHGLGFEVLTVRRARGLSRLGPQEARFSWFSGYAWQIVRCAVCGTHLGWRYTALGPGGAPATFYGLIGATIARG